MFPNPFWQALATEHAAIAIGDGPALRYPADVIPFAGMSEPDAPSMLALRDLLAAGETVYATGDSLAEVPGLAHLGEIPGLQMHLPAEAVTTTEPTASESTQIVPLTGSNADAMVALTNVAFPGFFRARTYILGSYWGIRVNGELIAMAGERVALPGYREISAVCTHPSHTGKGFAAALIRHIARDHGTRGLRSFLHVAANNQRAVSLYERLGFVTTTPILFHRLKRS
jgi:ribosomal protein S18 acetylase RimI-like enzyme